MECEEQLKHAPAVELEVQRPRRNNAHKVGFKHDGGHMLRCQRPQRRRRACEAPQAAPEQRQQAAVAAQPPRVRKPCVRE